MNRFELQSEETGKRLRAAINDIAADNRAGAAELLHRAAGIFSMLDAEHEKLQLDNEQMQALIIETCAEVARAQPLMTPIANLASSVITATIRSTYSQEMIDSAVKAARDFAGKAERAASAAAGQASEVIFDGATVLTHSRSSTVLAALVKAGREGKRFRVIATESRPVMEGRALARSLADERIDVTLIADMAAALMIEQTDMVMVGADRVTPESLINKLGTRMIALAARERGLPVYGLCDTSKFTAHIVNLVEAEHSAEELWPRAPGQITVSNLYFEPTPLACFSGVITEDGALDAEKTAHRASSFALHPALLDALAIKPA